MRLPVFLQIVLTALAVPLLMPARVQQPAQVTIRVLDIAENGTALAQMSPAPYVMTAADQPLRRGDVLHCTVEAAYLDCGDNMLKPLGFIIHGTSPDLRVERETPVRAELE